MKPGDRVIVNLDGVKFHGTICPGGIFETVSGRKICIERTDGQVVVIVNADQVTKEKI